MELSLTSESLFYIPVLFPIHQFYGQMSTCITAPLTCLMLL